MIRNLKFTTTVFMKEILYPFINRYDCSEVDEGTGRWLISYL